jgi:hypothetical protein
MQVNVEIITPAVAEEMLKANVHNRDCRKRHVAMLAGAMTRGEWVPNGDAIKFSTEGVLLDGQHRLRAVMESGVHITIPVVRGLPSEAQITMDTHAKRKLSDILKLNGEPNYLTLAGALGVLWQYENGGLRAYNTKPTFAQLLQTLDKNADIRDSVRVGQRVGGTLKFSPSVASVAHWALIRIDADDAVFFFDRLIDGANLAENDPIRRVREVFLQNAMARAKFPSTHMFALLIKAWNAYRQGRSMKALRWRAGGANPEEFPTPI